MKLLNKLFIGAAAVFALAATGCSDETPDYDHFESKDVDFTYNVDDDTYTLDYYVVSHIRFNNTSSKQGNVKWDFGDGTTSTDPNPVHKFEKAGIYRVSLTVEGVGTQTYPILIYDIAPVLTIAEQSTDVIEFNNTTLTFNLELPNPENLKVRYEWRFPEGTTDKDGNPITTFTGYADENGNVTYPEPVKFSNIGSQRIDISTYFDLDGVNRRLEDIYLNVQVGLDKPAPTLYYAQRGGNIKAVKLVDPADLPKGTKIYPYDMGVSAGNTVMNLVYADVAGTDEEGNPATNGWIYILDAGKQYYYINDQGGVLGDGYINAMRTDGTNVNTVITNVGGAAFNDPFQGFASNGYLYYSDRNTGFSRIELTTRGAVEGKNKDNNRENYFVTNQTLPYYGKPLTYGAVHVAMQKDKRGVWWWAKNYNGNCILRFKDTDICKAEEAAGKSVPYPVIFSGARMRSMVVDETRNRLFIWRLGANEGFYEFPLPGDNEAGNIDAPTAQILLNADPVNTTADEMISTCQLALDSETGRVFFCWRPDAGDKSGIPAGLVYYDPATKKCRHYGEVNDLGMGLCINPNKTKLF